MTVPVVSLATGAGSDSPMTVTGASAAGRAGTSIDGGSSVTGTTGAGSALAPAPNAAQATITTLLRTIHPLTSSALLTDFQRRECRQSGGWTGQWASIAQLP